MGREDPPCKWSCVKVICRFLPGRNNSAHSIELDKSPLKHTAAEQQFNYHFLFSMFQFSSYFVVDLILIVLGLQLLLYYTREETG